MRARDPIFQSEIAGINVLFCPSKPEKLITLSAAAPLDLWTLDIPLNSPVLRLEGRTIAEGCMLPVVAKGSCVTPEFAHSCGSALRSGLCTQIQTRLRNALPEQFAFDARLLPDDGKFSARICYEQPMQGTGVNVFKTIELNSSWNQPGVTAVAYLRLQMPAGFLELHFQSQPQQGDVVDFTLSSGNDGSAKKTQFRLTCVGSIHVTAEQEPQFEVMQRLLGTDVIDRSSAADGGTRLVAGTLDRVVKRILNYPLPPN